MFVLGHTSGFQSNSLFSKPVFLISYTRFFLHGTYLIPGHRAPLQVGLCRTRAILIMSSLFGTRCTWLILSISCPSPGVSHFPKEPWSLWVGKGLRKHIFKALPLWKWGRQAVPTITGQIFSGAAKGGRCCRATSPHSRFWPLAGPAGKDHGEKPRKTKPSCLRILPAEQLAKSWQVWGGIFLETCFLCPPSWYLKQSVPGFLTKDPVVLLLSVWLCMCGGRRGGCS